MYSTCTDVIAWDGRLGRPFTGAGARPRSGRRCREAVDADDGRGAGFAGSAAGEQAGLNATLDQGVNELNACARSVVPGDGHR